MRTNTHQHTRGRRNAPGRALGAVLVALGLIATTSCSQAPEPKAVDNPVKLLQSVRVGLSPAAGVETIAGTTISVSAAGDSSAADTSYDAAQVVGELPVRVSLQYRAGEKSGSDLTELQGHTGPVEIDLTLENLTVKPRVIEYDAAGQTRSETALVGAPLTIAASTRLTGVPAGDVTAGSADGGTGTNGVLSSTEDGATVVQWATVLAPPRSGASTTLRLVADVKDFQVPAFDVAVQPGLNTDLSADGVLAGAFSSGTGSEMALQRRTIALVSDVNTVLTKAGSTITDVRRNLQLTSQTLGAKTAGELRDNSTALAATMVGLKEQLKNLGADLEGATKATQSTTASQLQQTVAAVDAMLGDTSAVPTTAQINGDGCAADVSKSEKAATVYSSVQTMASQLDAYAKVSAGCRDTVAGALQATMGPENPTAEECAEQGSMTCSLYGSAVTVTGALLGLVKKGDELVADLQPQVVEGAIKDQEAATATLEQVRVDLAVILDGAETPEDYKTALANVDKAIKSAQASVAATRDAVAAVRDRIDGLREKLVDVEKTANDAKSELGDGSLLKGSMMQQNQRLADELCELADGILPQKGQLSAEEVERLRSYLTATPCEATADNGKPAQELRPPNGFKDPLDARLKAQTAAWDAVLAAADTSAPDQAFGDLETTIDDIDAKLDAISEATKALDRAATGDVTSSRRELEALNHRLGDAIGSSGRVGTTLAKLKEQQDGLGDKIKQSLRDVSAETAAEVFKTVDVQVRQVAEIGGASSEAVITAFNRSISGLKSTSDEVVNDAEGTVNKQRDELLEQSDALAASLAKSTQSSLASIASGTSGSTRDVDGARALLSSSLTKVMLDLGDRSVNGSGLLGSMATSAAKAGTADYQLALASQNAEGYANIRSRDVAGLLLRQAQFKASLTAVDELPPFHLEVPDGATSQTLYTLTIGGAA
jgi:predicted  nucleic acid-binding Zn-ribbon protein